MKGDIILHPYVSEKTMNALLGTPIQNHTDGNRIEFIVRREASKPQIKEAFEITYRSGLTRAKAVERMDECADWGAAAREYRDFVRRVVTAEKPYNRGLCPLRRRVARRH